jgi:exo-beta-1,3-glucanase (GH17 family)
MNSKSSITAADILGNAEYQAISYGGYRQNTRDVQPTLPQLKEDMKILAAMGIKVIRTYNVHLAHAANVLAAIRELKQEDPEFEMYVMLGAWIDAKNAWTALPDRIRDEDSARNSIEIARAVELANQYPDIVKILAVGNEAMVRWAVEYYVEPSIILKWVTYLQDLKKAGKLPKDLWITSSDNFASWGGGSTDYHVEDLEKLIEAVDYLSVHTYPMHDTHYNPEFWGVRDNELNLTDRQKIDAAMDRAIDYSIAQYNSVKKYMESLGINKPIHIGESGWATVSNEFYGADGARAIDEYKAGTYYQQIREWSNEEGISVFYFEAFDEQWKDAANPEGSENHFGLFNLNAEAKYGIWELVDEGVFEGLTRDGKAITKSFNGNMEQLMQTVLVPPTNAEIMSEH